MDSPSRSATMNHAPKHSIDSRSYIEQKTQAFSSDPQGCREFCMKGQQFLKYRSMFVKNRFLFTDKLAQKLYWSKMEFALCTDKAQNSIVIKDIVSICFRAAECPSSSSQFRSRFQLNERCCMCIITPKRTIDLEAPAQTARDNWTAALLALKSIDNSVLEQWQNEANRWPAGSISSPIGSPISSPVGSPGSSGSTRPAPALSLGGSQPGSRCGATGARRTGMSNARRTMSGASQSYLVGDSTKAPQSPSPSSSKEPSRAAAHSRESKGDDSDRPMASSLSRDSKASRNLSLPNKALECGNVVRQIREDIGADRGRLWRYDPATLSITSVVAEGSQGDITLPVGRGIVGSVINSGRLANVPDAYEDRRFNQADDTSCAYKTTSILCAPVLDADGIVLGAIELINKADHQDVKAFFTQEHETALQTRIGELVTLLRSYT